MRSVKVFLSLCLAGVSLAWVSAYQAAPSRGAILFEGARLLTGDGTAPVENSAVLIENGYLKVSPPPQ